MFAVVLLIKSTIQILNKIKWKFSKLQLLLNFKGWSNARFCIHKIVNQKVILNTTIKQNKNTKT